MDRIFWIADVSELGVINPFDGFTNGLGSELSDTDKVLVGTPDDFQIFTYRGFVATNAEHNPPYAYCGPLMDGYGYPLWKRISFSFSYQCLELNYTTAGDHYCTDGDNEQMVCDFVQGFLEKGDFIYSVSERINVSAYENNTYPLNSTTSSDWEVLATGNTPVFESDHMKPSGSVVPGGDHEIDTTFAGMSGDILSCFRGNMYHLYSQDLPSNGTDLDYFVTHEELSTEKTSWVGTPPSLQLSRTVMGAYDWPSFGKGGENQEVMALGMYWDDGSKPEQGCVAVVQVNTDFTMTELTMIDDPVPARYGKFGSVLGVAHVNDTTHGSDVHVMVANVITEDIQIFSKAQSWANIQTISFSKSDLINHIAGHTDIFACHVFYDATSTKGYHIYTYDGSAWSESGSRAESTSFEYQRILCTEDQKVVVFDTNNEEIRIFSSAAALLATETVAAQAWNPRLFHIPSQNGDVSITTDALPNAKIWIFAVDTVLDTITLKAESVAEMETVGMVNIFDDVDSRIIKVASGNAFRLSPALVTEYDTGLYSIVSNSSATQLDLTDIIDANGSVSQEGNELADVTIGWAISTDNKTTWQTYNGAWSTINPVTEIGADVTYFDSGMQDLDTTAYDQIDFCIQMNVSNGDPGGIVKVVSFTVSVLDNGPQSIRESTVEKDFNSLVHSSNKIYASENCEPRIAFFDTLK